MAFYGKKPSLLFLLVLLFSIYQIQARESKFFSKVIHYSNNKDSRVPLEVPSTSPTSPAPAPASEQTIAQNGYGLYGRGSTTKTTPTSSTTVSANDENEIIPEELANESYKESTPAAYTNSNYNTNYYNNGYPSNYNNNGYRSQSNYNNNGYQSQSNYNNNGYETEQQGISQSQSNYNNNGYQNQRLSNYNKNGYETEQQGMSQSQSNYNNNGYQSQSLSNYNNNGYQSKSNYNNNGYETEQQGMSDTKFLENGKYYYDVKKNENNYVNGYESGRASTRSDVYYGNNMNPNEFNTMEEYYKSQGEYEP